MRAVSAIASLTARSPAAEADGRSLSAVLVPAADDDDDDDDAAAAEEDEDEEADDGDTDSSSNRDFAKSRSMTTACRPMTISKNRNKLQLKTMHLGNRRRNHNRESITRMCNCSVICELTMFPLLSPSAASSHLVDPREHVRHVAKRIVRVQIDRSRAATRIR